MKSLTKVILAGLLSTGCYVDRGEKFQSRFGIEPQYYQINEIKTGFPINHISTRTNVGIFAGEDTELYRGNNTTVTAGIDLRLNLVSGSDNRSTDNADFGDCTNHGKFTIVEQNYLVPIPFLGLEQKIGDSSIVLEAGLPYARWEVTSADTFIEVGGEGCINHKMTERETGFGTRIRLGIRDLSSKQGSLKGFYIVNESYNNSALDVDVWSLHFEFRF